MMPVFRAIASHQLNKIIRDLKHLIPEISAGDLAAWAVFWRTRETNEKGRILFKVFYHLKIIHATVGKADMFIR